MKMIRKCKLAVVVAVVMFAVCAYAQAANSNGVDPGIAQRIRSIQAIDNHAHPVLAPPEGATDREFDALPVESLEPESDPVALRADFPPLGEAWKGAVWI